MAKPKTSKKSGKKEKPTYVVTLPLATIKEDERLLLDRVEVGKRLNNVCLQAGFDIVDKMIADPAWDLAKKLPRQTDDQRILRGKTFSAIRKSHLFSKANFETLLIYHKNTAGFAKRIGSHETQKIAERVFASLDRWVLRKGGKPRFKSIKRPLHSLEGKNNLGVLQWKDKNHALQIERGWIIPAVLPDLAKDEWLYIALQGKVKYCRILWRMHKGKKTWFVQLMMAGKAPLKASLLSRLAKEGTKGGIDIGPSNIAWCTETDGNLFKFCAEVDRPHNEIRILNRKLDRQRRANNPDNYNEDGTIIKGKKTWSASNKQKNTEVELQELYRHEAAVRKNSHGRDINELLSKALEWRDDGVSPKALQKMYGKSIAVRAPGHFMSELQRKAERAGGKREIIDVRNLKNSQYDHTKNDFQKKTLSERTHVFRDGRGEVQRDLYSAFLARNSSGSTYEPPELERLWERLAPALASRGLYKEKQQIASEGLLSPAPIGMAMGQSDSTVNSKLK